MMVCRVRGRRTIIQRQSVGFGGHTILVGELRDDTGCPLRTTHQDGRGYWIDGESTIRCGADTHDGLAAILTALDHIAETETLHAP